MDKVDAAVGAKIRFRRQQLKLSQDAVAAALGLTFQQLQKYEKGLNRVSASRLYSLSRMLNVLPGYFFDDDRKAKPLEPGEAFLWRDRDCLRLNQAFHRISNLGVRRAIVLLVQAIAGELAAEALLITPLRELQSADR